MFVVMSFYYFLYYEVVCVGFVGWWILGLWLVGLLVGGWCCGVGRVGLCVLV